MGIMCTVSLYCPRQQTQRSATCPRRKLQESVIRVIGKGSLPMLVPHLDDKTIPLQMNAMRVELCQLHSSRKLNYTCISQTAGVQFLVLLDISAHTPASGSKIKMTSHQRHSSRVVASYNTIFSFSSTYPCTRKTAPCSQADRMRLVILDSSPL